MEPKVCLKKPPHSIIDGDGKPFCQACMAEMYVHTADIVIDGNIGGQ